MNCYYCHHTVDMDEPGWGGNDDNEDVVFHLECLNMYVNVQVA